MTPYKHDRRVEHGTKKKKKTAVRMGLELNIVKCLVGRSQSPILL